MKKAAQAIANQRLKAERELRGWSQKYVAEQIGADHYYLSRWERGTASPSPYYRQKLCVLFGKNARELGFQPDSNSASSTEMSAAIDMASSSSVVTVHDPIIPPLTAGTLRLVGRDNLLDQLKQRLFSRHSLVLTALNGLPGVGKTALALALVHDQEVSELFHHGILWAGLGPQPNILGQLSRWGTLLGITAAQATKLTSIEAWTHMIHAALASRSMLLVIDDAWEIDHALAFKVGGPNCAYLLTTRFPHIALQFAADGATMVHELNEQESITLLAQLAPEVIKSELHSVQEIVSLVGGLPLALTLIGKYLAAQGYSGQPRRIRSAIQRLRDAEARLQLSEPKALLERTPSLPKDSSVSLQSVIEVSDLRLDEQARRTLRALSVFPAKPNSFSEEAALAVGEVTADILDTLCDAGLLESKGEGRYTLHQTIADYARTHLQDTRPYQRLAAYFADYVETNEKDYDALELEMANFFAALDAALEYELHAILIRSLVAAFPFLDARGLYGEQTEAYLKRAEHVARLSQDETSLATVLLNLGRITVKSGQYAQADVYLLEGLALARQTGNIEQMCHLLTILGGVNIRRGAYAEAEALLQEGLLLARKIENYEHVGRLLTNLGWGAHVQGKYTQAKVFYEEGLAVVSQVDDHEKMLIFQSNLGVLAADQGNLDLAKTYYEQALLLARRIGHRERIGLMLNNLGATAMDQGLYDQAEDYFQQGLVVTRQIGDSDQVSMLLNNLGETDTARGNYDQAESYFNDSIAIARETGNAWHLNIALSGLGELYLKQQKLTAATAFFREMRDRNVKSNQKMLAIALYGLARIAFAQGNAAEARQQGQESLAILESMNDQRVPEVRQWLHILI